MDRAAQARGEHRPRPQEGQARESPRVRNQVGPETASGHRRVRTEEPESRATPVTPSNGPDACEGPGTSQAVCQLRRKKSTSRSETDGHEGGRGHATVGGWEGAVDGDASCRPASEPFPEGREGNGKDLQGEAPQRSSVVTASLTRRAGFCRAAVGGRPF